MEAEKLEKLHEEVCKLSESTSLTFELAKNFHSYLSENSKCLAVLENEVKNLKEHIQTKIDAIKEAMEKNIVKNYDQRLYDIEKKHNELDVAVTSYTNEDKKGKWNIVASVVLGICTIISSLIIFYAYHSPVK